MKNKNRGESLIELLVSIGLLTLIAIVFLYIFTYVIKLNSNTDDKISATYVCEQRAEYLYSTSQDVKRYTKSGLLYEMTNNGFELSGPLLDENNRWYSPEQNENGDGTCKMYTLSKEHGEHDPFPGYTETVHIYFGYYYGNLSKVIIEAEKDEDISQIETIYSWVQ